jgi:hypothetical protein
MSAAIPSSLRSQVAARDAGCCAYCRSTERLMGIAFEIDHIVPKAAGGETSFDNLCVSCPTCNRRKAARTQAIDPESGTAAPLFHPNRQSWSDHFRWINQGVQVIGVTPTGRATVQALHLNRTGLVQTRRYWIVLGLHPPED